MEEQKNDVEQGEIGGGSLKVSPTVIGWGGASIVFTIFALSVSVSPAVLGAGFMAKVIAGIVGSAFGLAGALLGNSLRKFFKPDAVFTTDGVANLVWLKIFWAIGPQVIGLVIGWALGTALILD